MKDKKESSKGIINNYNGKNCKVKSNPYYIFGKTYFGPFLYSFINWLLKELSNDELKNVFFLARDGYMMKKAFDVCNTDGERKGQYVYFSRNALRFGLIGRCDNYKESLKYLTQTKYVQFKEILSYYGFDEDEMNSIADKRQISLSHNFLFKNLEKERILEDIYVEYKGLIKERSKESFDNLYAYLIQINMQGKFAIVDIGWHGSIQSYLQEMLDLCGIKAEIEGFYVGIDVDKNFNGTVKGFLYDNKNLKLRKNTLCFLGILEKLFQSLEGSTKGYIKKDNFIIPELERYEYEYNSEIKNYIKSWQNGALDYLIENNNLSISEDTYLKFAMPLLRVGKNPSMDEIKLFSKFYNTDGGLIYFLPQKNLFSFSPKEFILALNNSSWKTGFMKAAFKVPFPYYWIYVIMKK